MIPAWTKWRISSAIENGKPLSPGLARKVRRSAEYRRFYEASLAMAKRLREDADAVVRCKQDRLAHTQPPDFVRARAPSPPAVSRPSRRAFAFAMTGAVAGLLLVAGISWWPSPRAPDPGLRDMQLADVEELVRTIREIQSKVDEVAARKAPRLRQLVARSGEALRTPIVREANNIAHDAREFVRSFASAIRSDDNPQRSESQGKEPAAS